MHAFLINLDSDFNLCIQDILFPDLDSDWKNYISTINILMDQHTHTSVNTMFLFMTM